MGRHPQLLSAILPHQTQALCILDTAAAFSLLPGAAALAEQERDAFDELLAEDLRRRLVANRLDDSTAIAASVAVLLDQHPAVKAATPAGENESLCTTKLTTTPATPVEPFWAATPRRLATYM